MLLLDSSTDLLSIITSAAGSIDATASFMDITAADPPVTKGSTSGTQIAAITTATTTTIVAAPSSSDIRNIKTLHIRNKHATSACDITVQHNRSGTLTELHKVTLLAGESLEYIDGVGFFTLTLTRKVYYNRRVTTDYVNATTSFTDITGLTCPVQNGKHYNFTAHLYHIENAATTGAQFAINGPTMTAMQLQELGVVIPSVTAATMQANLAAVTTRDAAAIVATASATSASVVLAILSGWINPSADGTFAVRGASEVAVAAGLTVRAGSWLQLWEADN